MRGLLIGSNGSCSQLFGILFPALMNLASLLSEHRVLSEMAAETHREALAEMIDHLLKIGVLGTKSRDIILDALYAREERVSTGIGHGVAIPHCYCSELEKPVALLGRSRNGVNFDACDNAPVHFIILLIVPENQPNAHLQTLALIARLFARYEVRRMMSEAETAEGLIRVLEDYEEEDQ